MYFPFLNVFTSNVPDEQPTVVRRETQIDDSEGGEFLDDALRMEDLIPRTEEIVGMGTPKNLL